jgi:hypothetical protein
MKSLHASTILQRSVMTTHKGLSIISAAEHLLKRGLDECGCVAKRNMAVSAGGSLAAASQQVPP